MGLFSKKNKGAEPLHPSQQDVAVRIASATLGAQRRSAEWLNARASKIGKKRVVVFMAVLGLGFGLWCLYLVVEVLF